MSLVKKLATAMTTATFITVVGVSTLSISIQKKELQNQLEKAKFVLATLSVVSSNSLDDDKKNISIKEIIEKTLQNEDVISAKIYNQPSKIIINKNILPRASKWFQFLDIYYNLRQETAVYKQQNESLIINKFISSNNYQLGAISFESSTKFLDKKIDFVRNRTVTIVIVSSIIGISLIILIGHSFTVSLQHLAQNIEKMIQGKLEEPILVIVKNDLGIVTKSFILIVSKLYKHIRNLEQKAHDLGQNKIKTNALLNGIPDTMWILDLEGNLVDSKKSQEKPFLTIELVGQNINQFLPKSVVNSFLKAIKDVARESKIKTFEYEWFINNRRRHFEARIVNYGKDRVLAILRDNTDAKTAKEELKRAKEKAKKANITKNKFLANMSHELRTPLNGILGLSDLLLAEAEELGHQEFINDLKQIQKSGTHLLTLIEDILDASKLESNRVDFCRERFEITTLVTEVKSLVMPMIQKNKNTIVVTDMDDYGFMYSDRKRVKQILFHLLSNAAKFTYEGEIKVSISRRVRHFLPALIDSRQLSISQMTHQEKQMNNPPTSNPVVPAFSDRQVPTSKAVSKVSKQKENSLAPSLLATKHTDKPSLYLASDWIIVEVCDTGIGMSPQQIKQIFQPFIQADLGTTKKYAGTGLGLTICKSFCEMMGGNIKVESVKGKGSTFTFWLPATLVKAPQTT